MYMYMSRCVHVLADYWADDRKTTDGVNNNAYVLRYSCNMMSIAAPISRVFIIYNSKLHLQFLMWMDTKEKSLSSIDSAGRKYLNFSRIMLPCSIQMCRCILHVRVSSEMRVWLLWHYFVILWHCHDVFRRGSNWAIQHAVDVDHVYTTALCC